VDLLRHWYQGAGGRGQGEAEKKGKRLRHVSSLTCPARQVKHGRSV
jgi:hypothetical protein